MCVCDLISPADDITAPPPPPQFVQEALTKNDSVLQFDSPSLKSSFNPRSLRTVLRLDNVEEELKSFEYHPNPHFDDFAKNVITETSVIIVTVRAGAELRFCGRVLLRRNLLSASHQGHGFAKAMTAKEAQAFVGDASCHVNILQVNTSPAEFRGSRQSWR